ncbi:hypothetical protein L1049_011421 [Liquidambar formosana]|uniref:Uncharacterized protein n=1 Tax=Liquidambar formosana TaxID=63359 RepID=A0AAP0RRL9_LIQFO
MLASSRETIQLDNLWNLGILDHVPYCFVNAIKSCVKSTETAPWFSVARVLEFFPTQESPFKELNRVRQSIRTMVQTEKILLLCIERGVPLTSIPSMGKFVLHTSVDLKEYDEVLRFVGVSSLQENYTWYKNCIESCNLISRLPIDVYMELLCFLADNWRLLPYKHFKSMPLLKYVTRYGEVLSCSVSQINHKVGVVVTSISQYCSVLGKFVAERKDLKLAVFLAYLLFGSNPFIGESGNMKVECGGTDDDCDETDALDKYVDLGEVYGEAAKFAGESTGEKKLLDFLAKHTRALDLPDIPPMNLELEVDYSQLTGEQAYLATGLDPIFEN